MSAKMPLEGPTYIEQRSTQQSYSYSMDTHTTSYSDYANSPNHRQLLYESANQSSPYIESPNRTASSYSGNHTQESASSILQSVKEQEEQFERLTRELEAEREIVANQLEQCQVGSNGDLVASDEVSRNSTDFLDGALVNRPNDSSLLVESCLRALEERVVMESEPITPLSNRNKQVAFQSSTENQLYTDTRSNSSIPSSHNSYRQPLGNGMTRSQASYSLDDNYSNYNQLEEAHSDQGEPRQPSYNTGLYNSQPESQHSEGDYVDSETASTYAKNYQELEHTNKLPPDTFNQLRPDAISESRPRTFNNYINHPGVAKTSTEGSYRSESTLGSKGNLYEVKVAERSTLRSSRDNLRGSKDLTEIEESLNQLRNSRQQLSGSQGQLDSSRERLGSREQLSRTGSRDQLTSPAKQRPTDDYSYPNKQGRMNAAFKMDLLEHQKLDSSHYSRIHANEYSRKPPHLNDYSEHPNGGITLYADRPNGHLNGGDYVDGTRFGSQHSLDSRPEVGDQKFRPPDLPEVIEYLGHPNDAIKANAAAYLQHLCYGNHAVKARTRVLKGIPALVAILTNPVPEVHRSALGALLNLSRGYENDENKREIRSCGGLQKLVHLLDSSQDNDVRELVSGILWNLSSLAELKKPVMTICLDSIVKSIIIPCTGLQTYVIDPTEQITVSWCTEFRNAMGVIRNLSSDGYNARKTLRECDGLIECLVRVTQAVSGKPEMDNKPVENVVCTLRNLSFRLMEIDYPEYYDRKSTPNQPETRNKRGLDIISGCFGQTKDTHTNTIKYPSKTQPGRRRGEQLWQKELIDIYLPLLSDCSNTDTLEATVGAVQNLSACEWEPSVKIREHIRKQRGLPTIVELLGLEEADSVVCGAAIALRNLAIDKSNKILIGKYAITQLVSRLPPASAVSGAEAGRTSEETTRAVLATLYEVFRTRDKESCEHASTLVNDGDGLARLMSIAKSRMKYTAKTLKGAHLILAALWRFVEMRASYRNKGYKESDFLSKTMLPRPGGPSGSTSVSSTLNRPRSETPTNTNTISRNGTLRPDGHQLHPQSNGGLNGEPSSNLNESYRERDPSVNTLPIQRPVYQPHEDSSLYNGHPDPSNPQPGIAGSYRYDDEPPSRQLSYTQAQYPESYQPHGYTNQALSGSLNQSREGLPHLDQSRERLANLSQSREGLISLDRSRERLVAVDSRDSYIQGEPLYARVDKRKSQNSPFNTKLYDTNQAMSMNSLHREAYDRSGQPETPAADSWV